MRLRIVQVPPMHSIDGVQLDRFEAGIEYDVGHQLGSLMLAEGWAVPADIAVAPPTPEGAAEAVARDVANAMSPSAPAPPAPSNLIRELRPPYLDGPSPGMPADFDRRTRED